MNSVDKAVISKDFRVDRPERFELLERYFLLQNIQTPAKQKEIAKLLKSYANLRTIFKNMLIKSIIQTQDYDYYRMSTEWFNEINQQAEQKAIKIIRMIQQQV
jgi:hypothetical protein